MKEINTKTMPSHSNFKITIIGNSAHGSAPHLGNDAIYSAATLIMNIQGIAGRMNDPLNPLAIIVNKMKGGQRFNIIANLVEIDGAIYTATEDLKKEMEEKLKVIAINSATMFGCTAEVDFS